MRPLIARRFLYTRKATTRVNATAVISLLLPVLVALCLVVWPKAILGSAILPPKSSKTTYILHMERNSSHTDISTKAAWYRELLQRAKPEASADYDEDDLHHVYHHALNGFSALLTAEQAAYLQSSPEVLQLQPDRLHTIIQTTYTPEFLGLATKDGHLWPESNYGDDVIVGVVDTGVWPERLSFDDQRLGPIPPRWKGKCESGTNFSAASCNRKLIGARAFYKGFEGQFREPINESLGEYKSPRDALGHGTHTASTATGRWSYRASISHTLGQGTARGMAPKARLAVYKVVWFDHAAESDILAAIDQAVADGIDVISFSIGVTYDPLNGETFPELFQDMMSIATYGAMKKGVFVSVAAGNAGPVTLSVANVAPWMTTVGATTTDRIFSADVVLGNGTMVIRGESLNTKALGSGSSPLIYGGDAAINSSDTESAIACKLDSLNPALVKGKIVLCIASGDNPTPGVFEAGGSGVILATDPSQGEDLFMQIRRVLPTIRVGSAEGSMIKQYINSTKAPQAQLRLPAQTRYDRKPAPAVAAFSSRGPSRRYPFNLIKPDIVAPGVDIIAAGINEQKFSILTGTSMACPHVSGLGALLKAAHPTWSPAAIRSALMTTATTKNSNNATITVLESGRSGNPFDFGSGFVQPERATDPGLVYDLTPDDYLSYLCMLQYPAHIIRVFDADAPACPPVPIRSEDFNYPSFLMKLPTSLGISINASRTVTNVGPAHSTYVSTITGAENITITVHPPTLVFNDMNEKKSFSLTVSFTGSLEEGAYSMSSITWLDGVHRVRSPIVMWYF